MAFFDKNIPKKQQELRKFTKQWLYDDLVVGFYSKKIHLFVSSIIIQKKLNFWHVFNQRTVYNKY